MSQQQAIEELKKLNPDGSAQVAALMQDQAVAREK